MDVLYEESAINHNDEKGQKIYKILNVISFVALFIWVVCFIIAILWIPNSCNPSEENAEGFMYIWSNFLIFLGIALLFAAFWVFFTVLKNRVNVNYDYIFVSGDLRIAKIIGGNKRKLIDRIQCDEILQIGDVDNASFARLSASPDAKIVRLTPNKVPDEGKFFMYILLNAGGKKIYVLEAREVLLMNILRFVPNRNVLENDYVMQEKKQKA
ncbi:MAG: hypothetical protein E7355_00635 [Clostridiales bacterium]|nr:hypothetical protein [Clostridiales bacterium]